MKNKNKTKTKKAKKLCWIVAAWFASLLILTVIFIAANSAPTDFTAKPKDKYVSKYISNQLVPYIYNNAQKEKPFPLIIEQEKTKEFIDLASWPRTSGMFVFSAPQAYFLPDQFVIQSTA